MSSSRWGSDTWADNENWDSYQWTWKEWTTKVWSDSMYGPSHTWTTKGWHDNGSRRHGNVPASGVEANEELWKVIGSLDAFNAHADLWAGRDPDGFLPNAVDDTSSMHVNTQGREEQDDIRSRGPQSREEEQPRAAAALQNETPAIDVRPCIPVPFQWHPSGMPDGSYAWTLQYFENFTEHAASYQIHNEALKCIRDHCEAYDQIPQG